MTSFNPAGPRLHVEHVVCVTCDGSGWTRPPTDAPRTECTACDGTGRDSDDDKCWTCDGDGWYVHVEPRICDACKGFGFRNQVWEVE